MTENGGDKKNIPAVGKTLPPPDADHVAAVLLEVLERLHPIFFSLGVQLKVALLGEFAGSGGTRVSPHVGVHGHVPHGVEASQQVHRHHLIDVYLF